MESRNLVYSDGSSNKFWKIELDGSSHTVTFGKIGTTGQSQTKSFDSRDAAKKAFDKLVAEKTKKGYVDADVPQETKSAKTPAVKKAAKPKQASQSEISDSKESSNESPTSSKPIAIDGCLDVERTIDLSETDWYRASFRKLPPLDRGAAREFDRDQAIQKIAKLKTTDYGWRLGWNALDLPDSLSTDEAHFWLIASTSVSNTKRKSSFLAWAMSKEKITGKVSVKEASNTIHRMDGRIEEVTTRALANLFSPIEYLDLMLALPDSSRQSWQHALSISGLVDGFNRHVVPYMTIPQREEIRNRILKNWDPTIEPSSHPASNYEGFPVEYYVAASIGMHEEVLSVVSRWSDDRYQKNEFLDHRHKPQELLFGLGSAQIIESEWRRLRLKMRTPADVRAFLACTEYAALDCVANDVITQTNKDECQALLNAFTLVRAPEAAEPMLRCRLEAKIPAIARAWLDRNVGCAVEGLIETAGGKGKLAEAAIEYLRGVKKRGFAEVVSSALKARSNSASAVKVQTEVLDHEEKSYEPHDAASTPDWLAKELREATGQKRKSLPSWATPALLPPLIVGERRLNDQQVELVLQVLATTPPGTKHPLLTSVAENSSKLVRDEFAWNLFQLWQEDGCASKDKWAMGAMGHLGDDNCVLKLTPLIRVWPGESQHARAVFGLECLRAIGSSMALMNLSGIAQKLKFKGLKSKAEQFVAEIAKDRGLTREELEDRVVPDCGLDEKGRREFSFGPRSFSFILGGDLKAAVRDESGKIRSDLPAANSKDDEAKAKESIAEWKLMKKQIKDV
ncbi:MAG: WGR domain-containing protein, partial [Pirellula sp.]|nr:WGR domain-containing protein [Pirellula sp.]